MSHSISKDFKLEEYYHTRIEGKMRATKKEKDRKLFIKTFI